MASPSALRWLASGWLCGTEKDQPLISPWTLHAPDATVESDGGRMARVILEFGFSTFPLVFPRNTRLYGPGKSAVVPRPDSGEHGWRPGAEVDGDNGRS